MITDFGSPLHQDKACENSLRHPRDTTACHNERWSMYIYHLSTNTLMQSSSGQPQVYPDVKAPGVNGHKHVRRVVCLIAVSSPLFQLKESLEEFRDDDPPDITEFLIRHGRHPLF